mgnify:CR=1 FL=1
MHSVRRVRAIGIVTVVFTLGMLAAHPAVAQSDHEIVYVEDFAHGKVDPSPYAPGTMENPWIGLADNTGGIEPAVNSCKAKHTGSQDGASLQGCIVVLPRGFVEITETIDVNWDDVWLEGLAQYGIVVRGHGYGLKENGLSRSFAETILVWQGEANATVLRIRDTSFSSFEDFLIDGDGDADGYHKAGIGIEVTSGGSAKNITIRRVGIESVTGDPGVGIDAGSSFQMSEMEFDTLWIRGVNVGVHQWGKQTADVTYRKIEVAQFEKYGMDFEAAPIDVLPFNATVATGDATAEPGEVGSSCGGESLHGVWYRFTPATTVTARVDTVGSGYDTVLSVWIGTSHPLRHLYCNDDAGGTASALEMTFRAGTPYLIKAEGGALSSGSLTLNMTALPDVPRPAGDDLADALVIGTLPYSRTLSAAGGTDEPGELAAKVVKLLREEAKAI